MISPFGFPIKNDEKAAFIEAMQNLDYKLSRTVIRESDF